MSERLQEFVEYVGTLRGDEKGEAQVLCDRLFIAFGHKGYKEAGAILEHRLKKKDDGAGTRFVDLLWPGRVLLEMKKRGAKLQLHWQQAFDYWVRAVPNRPRYVVLSNFDEFWVYDFDKQIDQPVDVVATEELPRRYLALNFLFPHSPEPIFGNNREEVSREAADQVATVFNSLIRRRVDRADAQRLILQLVVAMFSEDMELLPAGTLSRLLEDSRAEGNSYDLLGGLFRQMNTMEPARGGRYKGVPYFNGGLFGTQVPLELRPRELGLLEDAAKQDWSKVNPAIFGALFQGSMDAEERHALGAHYTSEADILRVVRPTIVEPWRQRIEGAKERELLGLRNEMLKYRVLDPACGSGNFLYVAYREVVRLQIGVLAALREVMTPKEFRKKVTTLHLASPRQFHGIDIDSFGVELAKVTLMLAKKLALDEAMEVLGHEEFDLDLDGDRPIPLDNLDGNVTRGDALLVDWPEADSIIGNPPYQSKNKMQAEYGKAYVNTIRAKYPGIPGRADYCVYWFRKAHDHLKPGQRAGLVGTNTIRQNYSREGGLDYIVDHGGTITEAVSTQVWSGEAAVHVSIVNWVKGPAKGLKHLYRQVGDQRDSPWERHDVETINSALSFGVDVTDARVLASSAKAGGCYQGQTHGHAGFLLPRKAAEEILSRHPAWGEVLRPYLTADELLSEPDSLPTRYVIDFGERDLLTARQGFGELFAIVEKEVLPTRKEAARREAERNAEARRAGAGARTNEDHTDALDKWWQLFRRRGAMLDEIRRSSRFATCGRVTKRPIFEFVSSGINPNDALMVFPYADDYSFGILQSDMHWQWFVNRCSTLTARYRYTSNSVFDSFAWPQAPSSKAIQSVAAEAVALRTLRRQLMAKHRLSLRELYQSLDKPGKHPLKDAHQALDAAARNAYGMATDIDPLAFLLALNLRLANTELRGDSITGPGLPPGAPSDLLSADCVRMP